MFKTTCLLCISIVLLGSHVVWSSEKTNVPLWNQSIIDGKGIVTMNYLFRQLRKKFSGTVLKVSLKLDGNMADGAWKYCVKLLTADGQVLMLEYDARTLILFQENISPFCLSDHDAEK